VRPLSAWRWSLCLAVVAAVAPALRGEQPSPGETAPVWDVVTLSNGDEIRCRVVDHTDERVIVDHPVLGRVTLTGEQVTEIKIATPPPADADTPPAPAKPKGDGGSATPDGPGEATSPVPEPAPVDAGLFGTGLMRDWERRLDIGFSGSEGNSESFNVTAAFKGRYKSDTDRWLLDLKYFRGSSDGDRSKNEFLGQVTKDWLLPDSNWFLWAKGEYRYDQFQAWEHRISGFGGLGYTLLDNEKIEVVSRGGLGATYEFGDVNEFTPEALFSGAVIRWHINDIHTLAAETTVFPNLEDLGEYRWTNSAEWLIRLDDANGLRLKFGIEHEYESDPAEGDEATDIRYYGALAIDF